jgi:hypothetical protein
MLSIQRARANNPAIAPRAAARFRAVVNKEPVSEAHPPAQFARSAGLATAAGLGNLGLN